MNDPHPPLCTRLLREERADVEKASEMAAILELVAQCDERDAARIGNDRSGVRLIHGYRILGARINTRDMRNVRILVDALDPEFDVMVGRVLILILPKFPVGDDEIVRRSMLIDAAAKAARTIRTAIASIGDDEAVTMSEEIGRRLSRIGGGIVAACGIHGTRRVHAPTPWSPVMVTDAATHAEATMPPAVAEFVASRIPQNVLVDVTVDGGGRCHVDMATRFASCDAWDATSTMRLFAGIQRA
jgi:hypothetical protein